MNGYHPLRSLGERGAHKKNKVTLKVKQNWIVLRRPVKLKRCGSVVEAQVEQLSLAVLS